jgi:hypothetical protein
VEEIANACEQHTPAVLDERETGGGRKMALAAAGRTSVIVPYVSAFEVRITYIICFIRAAARLSL